MLFQEKNKERELFLVVDCLDHWRQFLCVWFCLDVMNKERQIQKWRCADDHRTDSDFCQEEDCTGTSN